MIITAVLSVKNKHVISGNLQTLVLTLVDKDTEIIDDYKNYYSIYSFKTDAGDIITHKVKNEKLDIDLNKKTAFTFLDGEIVAYKPNKTQQNSAKVLDVLSHTRSNPNIFISFIAIIVLNLPFFNILIYLFYGASHLFERDDYSLINDQVVNTAKDKTIVPLALFSSFLGILGTGLIFYDYLLVGLLINLVISVPFIYNSNRIEREVIAGKHRLISKIKDTLNRFKI